jgi:hypothetical protein
MSQNQIVMPNTRLPIWKEVCPYGAPDASETNKNARNSIEY